MAKTRDNISMDFNKARQQAEALENIARNIRDLAERDFENCMQGIASSWKSESAKQYRQKGNIVKTNLQKMARELQTIAGTMREIAKNTYDAEMQAVEIAEQQAKLQAALELAKTQS